MGRKKKESECHVEIIIVFRLDNNNKIATFDISGSRRKQKAQNKKR